MKLKTISTKEFKWIRFKESLKTERSIFKTNTISVYIKTTVRQQTLFFVCWWISWVHFVSVRVCCEIIKDHLSETVWVSLRPITAFSAVACVQSLINVKKYWKNCIILYADGEGRLFTTEQNWIIIMQTLEHDTTRLWGKQLKIVHFDIWCRLEVGCSEMPVKCQYCFKLNDAFVFIYRCCQLNS